MNASIRITESSLLIQRTDSGQSDMYIQLIRYSCAFKLFPLKKHYDYGKILPIVIFSNLVALCSNIVSIWKLIKIVRGKTQ